MPWVMPTTLPCPAAIAGGAAAVDGTTSCLLLIQLRTNRTFCTLLVFHPPIKLPTKFLVKQSARNTPKHERMILRKRLHKFELLTKGFIQFVKIVMKV